MSGYPRSMTAAPNYSSSPYRPPLQQSRYGTGQAAPPSPAISSEDRHLSESMSKMSFNPPPSPPSSTRTTDSRDAAMVFHTWPVVFDILDPVNPVMRLELELLFLALARFLVIPPASFEELVKPVPRADGWQCCCWECKQCKEISPQNSLCVCPAKLQRFYEIFSVSNDENWSGKLHIRYSTLVFLLQCQYLQFEHFGVRWMFVLYFGLILLVDLLFVLSSFALLSIWFTDRYLSF